MTPTIIADAGLNHMGSVVAACDLASSAKVAGADVVKYQVFRPGSVPPSVKDLGLPDRLMLQVVRECERIGIEFCATPDDLDSLKFLVEECGVKRIKIGSGSLMYPPLVVSALKTGLPVIFSTGMATMNEVARALQIYLANTLERITLLHCVSLYPCPRPLANVGAMKALRIYFGCAVGLSDHTADSYSAIVATGLGASVIEKHIMLPGTEPVDHAVSLDPSEFFHYARDIRAAAEALGHGRKEPSPEEVAMIPKLRKDANGRQPTAP